MKPAGYSGTPLPQKLGLKPGQRVWLVNAPAGFEKNVPRDATLLSRLAKPLDFVAFFTTSTSDLQKRLPQLIAALTPNGMIWVCWPKKASKVPTDLTEDVIRDFALTAGVADVKVCAIDEVWSGLKLVIRVKDRQ